MTQDSFLPQARIEQIRDRLRRNYPHRAILHVAGAAEQFTAERFQDARDDVEFLLGEVSRLENMLGHAVVAQKMAAEEAHMMGEARIKELESELSRLTSKIDRIEKCERELNHCAEYMRQQILVFAPESRLDLCPIGSKKYNLRLSGVGVLKALDNLRLALLEDTK